MDNELKDVLRQAKIIEALIESKTEYLKSLDKLTGKLREEANIGGRGGSNPQERTIYIARENPYAKKLGLERVYKQQPQLTFA